jgi:hypothetical protein
MSLPSTPHTACRQRQPSVPPPHCQPAPPALLALLALPAIVLACLRNQGECRQLAACRLSHEVEGASIAAKRCCVSQHPGNACVDIFQHITSIALQGQTGQRARW